MDEKRILVYGMTNNPGGIETYLMNLLRSLEQSEFCLDFVTDFENIAHRDEIISSQSNIYYIPAKSKNLLGHWRALWRILKKHPEYKTIYFNILDAGALVTILVPWLLRKKIIVHSHNGATNKKRLHNICKPMLNFCSDKKIACSQLAASFMFGEKEECLIVPNAIDLSKYVYDLKKRIQVRCDLGIRNNFVVCHIGRITEQKNPFRIIDIIKATVNKEPRTMLLYIGEGELSEDVHEYAERMGVSQYIKFLGIRKDIPDLLIAADVFLLPSLYEGLPIVGVEAQACGLPCVLSDTITKEVALTEAIHFCSLEEDNNIWADALLEFIDYKRGDDQSRLQKAGYSLKEHTDSYYELFNFFKIKGRKRHVSTSKK